MTSVRFHMVCGVIAWVVVALIAPSVALAQKQGTFVGGLAVYRDAASNQTARAPGRDLLLISGSYSGPIGSPPPSVRLDEDTTANRVNGYRPDDEGIFQLYAADPIQYVSVAYRRNLAAGDDSKEPEFFSTTVSPRTRPQGDRLVAKRQLELWPTDRPIEDTVAMQMVVRGVIVTHVMLGTIEDKGDEAVKTSILKELKLLADLLPADKGKRAEILVKTIDALPRNLPQNGFNKTLVTEWIPGPEHEFWTGTGEQLSDEKARWERFRQSNR